MKAPTDDPLQPRTIIFDGKISSPPAIACDTSSCSSSAAHGPALLSGYSYPFVHRDIGPQQNCGLRGMFIKYRRRWTGIFLSARTEIVRPWTRRLASSVLPGEGKECAGHLGTNRSDIDGTGPPSEVYRVPDVILLSDEVSV